VSNLRPVSNREDQPAPDGWQDAYLESMENIWQHFCNPDGYVPAHVASLTAFAAEIRHGIAAGLLASAPGDGRMVPLLNIPMRDDRPSRPIP
jgi:hypothetical protein